MAYLNTQPQSRGSATIGRSETDHVYIGKIPAYNDKISNGITYEDRLKNNLTITTFEPTGYSVNLRALTNTTSDKPGTTGGKSSDSATMKKAIYRMGGDLRSQDILDGTKVTTQTSISNWLQMQKVLGSNKALPNPCKSFSIIATNDSTINETISNEFASNKINNIPSFLSSISSTAGKILQSASALAEMAKTSMTSMDSMSMISALQQKDSVTDGNQLYSLLLSQAIGIQSALPKIWQRSDYNNTSSFTIKLISPSGHPDDVQKYVIAPLTLLILAASPVTFDGVSYGYPPIWKINARGLLNINLAAITAIVITRGGQDTLFNRFNQPTNIDVRLTVEPLVSGFATPLISGINHLPNEHDQSVDMLVASPDAINETMQRTTDGARSFILNSLNL